jgi:N-glycosylase/DNA lyase
MINNQWSEIIRVIQRYYKEVIMNKEFVKKMIKAEKLRYEAIKEILPNNLREKIDSLEKDAFNLIKDFALEMIKEDINEGSSTDKKATKKVNVDFSEYKEATI